MADKRASGGGRRPEIKLDFFHDLPTTAALNKYSDKYFVSLMLYIHKLDQKAKSMGLKPPPSLQLSFEPGSGFGSGALEDTRGNPIGAVIKIPENCIEHPDSRIVKAVIAHEFAHLIDLQREMDERYPKHDGFTDKRAVELSREFQNTFSQAVERRAINLSLRLVDDPWMVAESYIETSKTRLEKTGSRGADRARARVIATGQRDHPALWSIMQMVEKYAKEHGFPPREDLMEEGRKLNREARDTRGMP